MKIAGTNSHVVLYEKVKADLVAKLASPSFDASKSIGSERDLISDYGVSRITIRRALSELEREGVIDRIPGKGTFRRPRQVAGAEAATRLMAVFREDSVYDDEFTREIYQGAVQEAHRLGYHTISGHAAADPHSLDMARRLLAEHKPEACLLCVKNPRDFIQAIGLDPNRTLIIDDRLELFGTALPSVIGDNFQGATLIMDHLQSLGHRRIAFLDLTNSVSSVSLGERIDAWRSSLASSGGDVELLFHWNGHYGPNSEALVQEIRQTSPSAIVCANDYLAASLLPLLRENGIRVPQDISVTGFDNLRVAEYLQLTSVEVPVRLMGEIAVKRSFNRLMGTDFGPECTILPLKLVVRKTTAPVLKSGRGS